MPPTHDLDRASLVGWDCSPFASGARVELLWQASGNPWLDKLGLATTDALGRARIELQVGALPTKSGRYFARVSKGARHQDWTLDNFPVTSSWRLYLPRPVLPPQPGSILENSIGMKLACIPPSEK
ncbi:MAG: hypothetical protein U1A77_16140 [Pirellulales bacterium]